MRNIKMEEYRPRWGARASNWLESRFSQYLNTAIPAKSGHNKPIAYRVFGKPNRPDNAAGLSPPLRRAIAAALMCAMAAAAVLAGAMLARHHPQACAISGPQAMPWVQEQRAGCPETRP